ncbi:hypothetical protein F5X99DRAFT_231602 [Biscogniauxia marginata]|nr:hypothetical protein F5X99DRAFT_231602 [Biscogniauxia marginata]
MMESLLKRASFPNWTQTPIPGFDLSPAGLIALADLGTIAQRTRIVGGSSWLDALLLAPGLHYQQAADAVRDGDGDWSASGGGGGGGSGYHAVELTAGKMSTYNIVNTATLRYLERVGGRAGQQRRIIVDVGMVPERRRRRYFSRGGGGGGGGGRSRSVDVGGGRRATIWQDSGSDLGWYSHVLYLASPVLTVLAFVLMILLREWWGVGLLLALMFSRVLNIWVIKQRAKQQPPPPPPPPPPHPHSGDGDEKDAGDLLTEYLVDLGNGRTVCLRGTASDLQAITTTAWLAAKTHVEGYLEAAAKLTVYLVAAFSGNMTQAGSLVFLLLLLVTAGLLGLSNAHAKTFRMHGRLAAPTTDDLPRRGGGSGGGAGERRGRSDRGGGTGPGGRPGTYPYPYPSPYPESEGSCTASSSWPGASDEVSSGLSGMDDYAERGQIGGAVRDRFPFDEPVEYK